MRAAWYEHRGDARSTLVVGEMPDPEPGEGEVRIALRVSGISPGDVKKRAGWQGSPMSYPRVIPHSDGAGTIDAIGSGVDPVRLGQRVWCYGAQSYRPFGTAADYTVVPDQMAIALPSSAGPTDEIDEQSSCLGIAGITAHRAVFADGDVTGLAVMVHGAAGGVGSIATQMARRGGATVLAIVKTAEQQIQATSMGAHHSFLNDAADLAAKIRRAAPDGVHRIAEVDFASHVDLDAAVLAVGGVVCSYFSSQDRPQVPYWTLGFKDVTLRLLGSDDFTPDTKATAARALTDALREGALRSRIAARFSLQDIAAAHEAVEEGVGGRVVVRLDR